MSATTTQLLSSGEFCNLRYDTVPVKSASANVSFYTNNSKMPNFELTPVANEQYTSTCFDIYVIIREFYFCTLSSYTNT